VKRLRLSVVALFMVLPTGMATDARARMGWESLTEPKTMNVVVWIEGLGMDPAALGLIRERVKTMVERRLSEAEIKVPADSDAYLDVNIRVSTRNDSCWADVFLKFMQPELPVDSPPANYVTAWETHTLGVANTSDFPGFIEAVLDECMDDFINDWLAANPKE